MYVIIIIESRKVAAVLYHRPDPEGINPPALEEFCPYFLVDPGNDRMISPVLLILIPILFRPERLELLIAAVIVPYAQVLFSSFGILRISPGFLRLLPDPGIDLFKVRLMIPGKLY